ncbi:MAG: response regulator transcription factor [Anaerolineae bacterium]|nr:response regulator transcription factor [Anaerolineae bacterium]
MNSDSAKVLLIESVRANGKSFSPALAKRYDLTLAYSGKQGIVLAQDLLPDVVILDAVSMRTSGDRICHKLRGFLPDTPIIHIRPPLEGAEASIAADVVLHQPLTWRKLVNRVKRFVAAPQKDEDLLRVGVLSLNVTKRILMVGDEEKRLTPKLVGLAEIFFKHPNTVIARKTLIQQVWKTEYMGDTRTLDVHVRWLREALEADPSHPRIITTIRGVGYRLVPPEQRA